jgi:uncharacterized protein (DUF362 family)
MVKVSLVKSKDSYKGTMGVLGPLRGELERKIKDLAEMVVKINFVDTRMELTTTPFEAVRGFVDFVKPFYSGKIVIAEEAALGKTEDGFRRFGFTEWAEKDPQVEIMNSGKSRTEWREILYGDGFDKVRGRYPRHSREGGNLDWIPHQAPQNAGQVRDDKEVSPDKKKIRLGLAEVYTKASFIVSICRPKTHDAVVVTLGIKNLLVGAIQQKLFWRRSSIHKGKDIHRILAGLTDYVYPDLVVIDGAVGMEGNGPIDGTAIESGWALASFDALAADSLGAYLMGFKLEDIGYLNLIREKEFLVRGRDVGGLYGKDDVEVVGEDPEKLVKPFKPHATFERQREWR